MKVMHDKKNKLRKHKSRLNKIIQKKKFSKHRSSSSSSSSSSSISDSSHSSHKHMKNRPQKRRKRHTSSSSSSDDSSSSSSSSSSSDEKTKITKKAKKLKSKSKTKKLKTETVKSNEESGSADVPLHLMNKSKALAPMTKEQWEKQQSVVRRVYDESTGRNRLIKGDGEVIEEIVSKDRHKQINKQATKGDAEYFQKNINKI